VFNTDSGKNQMKITGFMYSFIAHNGQEKMVAASFGTSRTKAKKYFNVQNNLQRLEPIKPHKLYEVSIVVGAEADRAKLEKQEHSGIGGCAMCGAAYEDQVIKAPAEPVAWADIGTCDVDNDAGLSWTPGHFHATPLYTTTPAAQRPWVGLTDERVRQLCGSVPSMKAAVREAEAELKEKNT